MSNHLFYNNKNIGIDCARIKQQHIKANILMQNVFSESVMYAKFPFYSIAQLYALSLNAPVAILLGGDNLYWVVNKQNEIEYIKDGCALLSYAC
jgi:hypothetical protein